MENKIGARIKKARKEKGYTQQELARLVGCSNTTVSKYEQGEIENMPRPRMQRLAEVLGVQAVALFGFAEEKPALKEDELSESQQQLIDLVHQYPEKADALLQAMKLFLGSWRQEQPPRQG